MIPDMIESTLTRKQAFSMARNVIAVDGEGDFNAVKGLTRIMEAAPFQHTPEEMHVRDLVRMFVQVDHHPEVFIDQYGVPTETLETVRARILSDLVEMRNGYSLAA